MAYDEDLAARIRDLAGAEPCLSEKKMFGGLAFLIGGNMAIAASGKGGIMVRVDPTESAAIVASTGAEVVEMRGRLMPGWLRVSGEQLGNNGQLAEWVRIGIAYASTLPPKR